MKEEKKDQILIAAEKLFSQSGFDGTSTRAIANEAGVNLAMLNYYFGSKDGVYNAVVEKRLGDFRQILSSISEENISSWDKLKKCVDVYADRIFNNNCWHKIIQRELSLESRTEKSDFIIDQLMKNVNEIQKVIQEGVTNGTFREVDTELTVATIFGTKYYLLNASVLASKLLNADLKDHQVLEEQVKPRLKRHLLDLLSAHLRRL
ncbi:TetR/AcrR family transcriptional regulator [Desertivirga arenae]|uniref:TetR/AcrR family transcriptional regulator n=1 Tax=Desertivirga arenae TaxID=2810309 RepID=UPI001A967BC6|nr:TetR/AcrR family transcriptional regulator [Pedobacter sp. SYSU D00823]